VGTGAYTSYVSLGSNTITFQPASYFIRARCPANMCGSHKMRIFNNTTTATIIEGTSEVLPVSLQVSNNSAAMTTVSFTTATQVLIQHICQTTRLNDGFGMSTSLGTNEIYTMVDIIVIPF
jgi:hypothetical protein